MAAPKKVDGKWRHRVMVRGKRTSGTFDTKAAALAWEAEQRAVARSEPGATTQTCKDAFDKYEREVSRKKKGRRWEALRLAAFGRLQLPAMNNAVFGELKVRDINQSHIAAFRDARLESVTGATVDREMTLLSNVFTIARKEWKWISASPTTDVSRPKSAPPRFRRINQEEIDQICIALGWQNKVPATKQQRVAAAFLFAIETAMRSGEICKLTKATVSAPVATVLDPKNGEDRRVPMSPRAIELWNMVGDGFGISSPSIDAIFRKARDERTTIKDLHFHDTRHEAITRLAKKLHVLDLARMTGHKDIKKLMIYYNESAEDIAAKL
ncbi:tyrosine-type recombinase/integrase [Duganella callida]|uniref:Site-specific integrase n=1 Tax=Duganella callida TaxID=2561932 RepID=A0A4Y9S3B1_9BURK|nr:site-specific integrase [Duganella callida]TFW15985.1 site-specific integrase [Duganella callida]